MDNASFNYLRTFRRRYGFTEAELAGLIGSRGHTSMSLFENGERVPTLKQGFGLAIVLGAPVHRLFPGLFGSVEEVVMQRVAQLIKELDGKKDPRSVAKREHLESLAGQNHDEV